MERLQKNTVKEEPARTLGDVLLGLNMITSERLKRAQALEQQTGRRLCDILVEQELVSPQDTATARSIHLKLPLIDLRKHVIQPDALKLIPQNMARKYNVIPLDIIGDSLMVVMADPEDVSAKDEMKEQAMMPIKTGIAVPSDIQRAIDINYKPSDEIEKQVAQYLPHLPKEAAIATELSGDAPIAQILDLLLSQAVKLKASDIHIEPQEDSLRIRFRIDGVIHDMFSLPMGVNRPLSARIKVQAGMNIAELRRPQDGQISLKIGVRDIDIRVASMGTIYGENLTLRILDKSLPLLTLTQVGFSQDALENYQAMLRSSYGLILVGGPTGSGKTTTLYASINELIRNNKNIMTIEDPIEYRFKGVNQTPVNPKANMTFANGLRALLRHDPDIILVGEIRDKETAEMAVQASLTGHLVLSSIHANSAVGVFFRLMDLGIEPYLITSTVIGVVAQRMVRRICPRCRAAYQPSPKEKAILFGELGEQLSTTTFYKGEGCNLCSDTCYAGRTGIFELLVMSEEIGRRLLNRASYVDISTQAIEEGMTTIIGDGLLKVREGVTTVSEVMQTSVGPGAAIRQQLALSQANRDD
jgi:type II secretory ATPase GspE/PulE/Tfp pilus assembly ATPase PilB-like protein